MEYGSMIEKQCGNSNILKVQQKLVVQRFASNKRSVPSLHSQARQPFEKKFHLNTNQIAKSKYLINQCGTAHLESQPPTLEFERHCSLYRNHSQWKLLKNQSNNSDKCFFYKNQQTIKPFNLHSNQTRRPMPQSLILPYKFNLNARQNSRKLIGNENQQLHSNDHALKQNLFTINRKELRKRKKGDKKSQTINTRIVNLFESLKQKLNTIRQKETHMIMGMNLKQYLEKIDSSNFKLPNFTSAELTVHTQTPQSKTGLIGSEDHLRSNEESLENSVIFQRVAKRIEVRREQIQSENEFDVKPWSTKEVAI